MRLTHYVVIRRDLPLGTMCAQIVHAAGESSYKLHECRNSSVLERRVTSPEVGGSIPSCGSIFDISKTTAVVLGARNEGKLERLEQRLLKAGVQHVAVREPDAPYNGELMAIGLVPADRELVADYVREFNILCEEPA